jgi:hypothetical protein
MSDGPAWMALPEEITVVCSMNTYPAVLSPDESTIYGVLGRIVFAVDASSGEVLWTNWNFNNNNIRATPLLSSDGKALFTVQGTLNIEGHTMAKLDTETGGKC